MAVKPNRTQAKQVAAYINGVPTRRVQSLDWASNFTIDSVFELGNNGVVEDAVTLVETSVNLTSNEWGTTDLEAMIFGIHSSAHIVSGTLYANTIATIFVANRGAGGTVPWAVGDWLQIIRHTALPTTNDTEYAQIGTIAAAANGAQAITLKGSGDRLTAAPGTFDIVTLVNKYTITQDTVDSEPAHFILPHRYSSTATTIMHSVILPRCYVDNLTYNLDTGGSSEQNYTLLGEEERLVLNSYREMLSVTGSFLGYNSTTGSVTFTVPMRSTAAWGTQYVLYAGSNLLKYTGVAGGTINHTTGAVTIHAYVGAGLGIDSTTKLTYYYWLGNTAAPRRGFKSLTNIDSSIGKLTKGYITVDLGLSTTSQEVLLRCTGVSINMPLTRESIDELGTSRSIAKPLEGNLRNELTLTFNRNDLREYAKLLGSEAGFDAGTLNEILMTSLKSVKTAKIVVKFYASQITHDATTLLKTMTFENCNFIGDNSTTPITGAAGVELNFSTQSVNIVGSGLPPVYI